MAKTMPKNMTEFFPEAELCHEYSESPGDSTQERPFECKAKHAALSTHRAHFSNRRVSDESDALPAANSKATDHGRGAKVQELLGCRDCGRAQTLFDAGPAEIKRSQCTTEHHRHLAMAHDVGRTSIVTVVEAIQDCD